MPCQKSGSLLRFLGESLYTGGGDLSHLAFLTQAEEQGYQIAVVSFRQLLIAEVARILGLLFSTV
jgi:hypothetical protein